MYNLFNEGTLNIHDPKTMIYFLDERKYEFSSTDINEFQKKMRKERLGDLKKKRRG